MQECKNPMVRLQNASTAAEPTWPILPTVLHTNNSSSYINGNRTSRSQQHLFFLIQASSLSSTQATDVSTLTT
jgi:hypothetical protein